MFVVDRSLYWLCWRWASTVNESHSNSVPLMNVEPFYKHEMYLTSCSCVQAGTWKWMRHDAIMADVCYVWGHIEEATSCDKTKIQTLKEKHWNMPFITSDFDSAVCQWYLAVEYGDIIAPLATFPVGPSGSNPVLHYKPLFIGVSEPAQHSTAQTAVESTDLSHSQLASDPMHSSPAWACRAYISRVADGPDKHIHGDLSVRPLS